MLLKSDARRAAKGFRFGGSFFCARRDRPNIRQSANTSQQFPTESDEGERSAMKRILAIENDIFILELLTDLLPLFGYCVEKASSGSAALEKLDCGEFDAILLDIHLADMDGKEVYRKVKERSSSLARRIIFMTGDAADPKTASFIQETGNRCLEKPFRINQLKEILTTAIE